MESDGRAVIHGTLDVTGMTCPGPFAEVKAVLDEMATGQKLEALIDDDQLATLSKSVKEEGHRNTADYLDQRPAAKRLAWPPAHPA